MVSWALRETARATPPLGADDDDDGGGGGGEGSSSSGCAPPSRTRLAYHPSLHVLLAARGPHLRALDLATGAPLHRAAPGAAGRELGVRYLPGCDRVVVWDGEALGVRADYNGVLLLHTVLQRPLDGDRGGEDEAEAEVDVELFLAEAALLHACMRTVDLGAVERADRVLALFEEAIRRAGDSPKKGVKAQKWNTIRIRAPHAALRAVAHAIVAELRRLRRHVPALAIASALYEQASELAPPGVGSEARGGSSSPKLGEAHARDAMYSEAARRDTFERRWPHMDYKWALPVQMAQAGFFYQPSVAGDDRAMCFACTVCLVSWERTDEPWSEHERHSPDCALVKGEYTHNVPLGVTHATCPAVAHPGVALVSPGGGSGDVFLTGTARGRVSVWNVDCRLRMVRDFAIAADEPLVQSALYGPYSGARKAWAGVDDEDVRIGLTSLAIVGRCQNKERPCAKNSSSSSSVGRGEERCSSRPSIVCAVKFETDLRPPASIWCEAAAAEDGSSEPADDSATKASEGVKAMNDQNEAKSYFANGDLLASNSFLVVYDFQGECAQTVSPLTNGSVDAGSKNSGGKSGGSKKCAVVNHACRAEDANLYDDIYFNKYLCLDEELSQEMALVAAELHHDQVTVIDFKTLNKELENKFGPSHEANPKSSGAMTGNSLQNCIKFISKVHPICEAQESNSEQYESGEKSVKPYSYFAPIDDGAKSADEEAGIVFDAKNDMTDIGCITDLLYEYKNSGIKMKLPYHMKPCVKIPLQAEKDAPVKENSKEEDPPLCRAVQCVRLPSALMRRTDLTISEVLPTIDGDHLLVVATCENATKQDGNNLGGDLMNGFLGTWRTVGMGNFETGSSNTMPMNESEMFGGNFVNMSTSFLILYSLNFDSSVTLINEVPVLIKEIAGHETPQELCLLPNLEKEAQGLGLVATVGLDGALRLINVQTLDTLAESQLENEKFVSVTFCTSIEKLCACTESGVLYFYAVRENEGDSTEEQDEEDIYLTTSESNLIHHIDNNDLENSAQSASGLTPLIAHKAKLEKDDLGNLSQLAGIDIKQDNVIAYGAVVPSCWCELLPTQRSRVDNQHFYRSWRLQNTSSTWDEHVLELTLPWSLSISHVELKFTLHAPCSNPPNIQVTLLKQHINGIGSRKDSKCFSRIDEQIDFNLIEQEPKGPAENPVRSKEYLRAHNAEILAGPLILAQDLDLTQLAGTLTLTSSRLYRARGRTLLIHIKSLFDLSKEINQGKVTSSKKSKLSDGSDACCGLPGLTVERFAMGSAASSAKKKVESYMGCDWLHEISITVRTSKHTGIPQERLQRIAMLESNRLFENLLAIATDCADKENQLTALDLLIWIVSIRLTRYRSAKSDSDDITNDMSNSSKSECGHKSEIEKLQEETVKIVQKNVTNLMKKCILLSKRSIAKKCVKFILICCKGAKNLDDDFSLEFEKALLESTISCLPLIGLVQSAGSLCWFTQLVMKSVSLDMEMKCATICLQLLKDIACIMQSRYNPYHSLLRSRFGLYGLPMESSIFDIEPPALGKTTSTPLTYSSVVAGDSSSNPTLSANQEIDLRDLYNYAGKSSAGWWSNDSSVCGRISGLSEVMPLRVTFHNASDGTHLDTAANYPSCPSMFTINSDYPQFWDAVSTKVNQTDAEQTTVDAAKVDSGEMNQDELKYCFVPCEGESGWKAPDAESFSETSFQYKDGTKFASSNGIIPWQILVQQPPQQVFVIKRMHPGARHFIVLDFGYPIKLTDLIIPACPEVVTLTIDIWLQSEDQDCTRLVLVPDISTKNLVMTDIQPPPLCQYLKITTIGRYNMSTTRCKIPLGWFYGEIAESVFNDDQQNASNLLTLHQDLICRFRLAVSKLTDCLDFYLETSGGNSAHITADIDQNSENHPLVKTIYQECIEIQQQITTVERIIERFNISGGNNADPISLENMEKLSQSALLKQASIDKLKNITEQLTDILLYICFESDYALLKRFTSGVNMSSCALITKWLIVCGGGGGPRLEAGLASVLVRLCSTQPWWGTFIANTLSELYSPSNNLIFSQNRVLILLIYMGRKSLLYGRTGAVGNYGGGVVECIAQQIAQLLPLSPDSTHNYNIDPVWQTTDLSLLGWLLIYLSACLDTVQPKDGAAYSWSRWSFLSSSASASNSSSGTSSGSAAKGSNVGSINRFHRRKFQKRLIHKIHMEDLESVRKAYQVSQHVQALATLSSQAANLTQHSALGVLSGHGHKNQDFFFKPTNKNQWFKRFEEFIQNRLTSLNKRVAGSPTASGSSSRLNASSSGNNVDRESSTLEGRPYLISQQLSLQVSRSLISLILSMDFTCNTDVLLLACKVVGRLNYFCGGLANIIKENEVLELTRAACSPAPWHQHALLMLLQDLIEYDHIVVKGPEATPSPLPTATESFDDTLQWHNTFPNQSDSRNGVTSDAINPTSAASNKEDSASCFSGGTEYLIEDFDIDEGFDMDDFDLEEMSDKYKNASKDVVIPKSSNTAMWNGNSIAIDARLGSGIEMTGEILIRKLNLLGGGSLATAIHSQPISSSSISSSPPTEHIVSSAAAGDLTKMLINSFHVLFTDPTLQDNNAQLERTLQLWITLNGVRRRGVTSNVTPESAFAPRIKLSTEAVKAIIAALNQQINVTLRGWVLAFDCFCCVSNNSSDSSDSLSLEVMAGVILEDPQFIELLVKFLSSNLESDYYSYGGDKLCVGPLACGTFTTLLQRLSVLAPTLARTVFLKVLCQLTAPGGALRNGRGPPDAQRELLHIAATKFKQYSASHLPDAMSLIESIGVIVNSMTNAVGVEVYGIGESSSSYASIDLNDVVVGNLGGIFALEVMGAKKEKPTCRRELIISLITFARSLVLVPLGNVNVSDNVIIEESQTDESKASQQSTSSSTSISDDGTHVVTNTLKVPCLADTVLQHYPTMRRIFKTLSMCSTISISCSNLGADNEAATGECLSFGDAIYKFALTLLNTATHPRLVLMPLLEYLAHGTLSEALIRFIIRTLEAPNSLERFVALGGTEVVCSRLISSHRTQLSPQPGLVAALMNHLKPPQVVNLSSATNGNSEKTQQAGAELSAGLLNYAPLSTVTSGNPSAQQADALLTNANSSNGNCGGGNGGGGAHRRTRSAAWSYHFSRGETSVDLTVKLPHAVLLHEVQLQPHLSTLSTCPSAVGLEVYSHGCLMTPLGPPQPTAGMTYIRLKLTNPLVVNEVLVRLYKPRDNTNLGLLNMRILGTAAFTTPFADKNEDKLARTSAGWALILWQSLCCSDSEPYLEARRRASTINGLAEATAGLFLSAAAPPPTLRSLLLALGCESATALRVLSLILYNGHVPSHRGYNYSVAQSVNSKTPVDLVCDLLYQLCTTRDTFFLQRIKTFIEWLKDCGESVISNIRHRNSNSNSMFINITNSAKYLSPVYIQCLASVLWFAKEHAQFDLKVLITEAIFDMIYSWIDILPKHAPAKQSLNSVLCSMCYIRPELFTRMLEKMGISMSETGNDASISDDRKDIEANTDLTDDSKVSRESTGAGSTSENLNLTPSQYATISAACMSPDGTRILLKSNLLTTVTKNIERFCNQFNGGDESDKILTDADKSMKKDLISFETIPVLIEWLSSLCISADIKNWLGEPSGSCFLKPLLMLLCLPSPKFRMQKKLELYTSFEEKTIKLFGALTSCHPHNQYLLATALYDVIKCHPETSSGSGSPISGFTRRLLLRLFFRSERISVAISFKNQDRINERDTNSPFNIKKIASSGPLPPRYLSNHPSFYGCVLFSLPQQTLLSDILLALFNGNFNDSSTQSNQTKKSSTSVAVGETSSNSQGNTSSWELSVAAANTAKDKRIKDAKNIAKQVLLQCKKKYPNRKNSLTDKKDEGPSQTWSFKTSVFNTASATDTSSSENLKIYAEGLDGCILPNFSLGFLSYNTSYRFGPNLNISIVSSSNNESTVSSENLFTTNGKLFNTSLLSIFAAVGGLALLAHHLPPISPPLPLPSQTINDCSNPDEWIKLDDAYEDLAEASSNSTSDETSSLVPTHSLVALGLLLKLPGYAETLLKEGQKAVYLLRLLLGVLDDGEGKEIMAVCGSGLGTLSFRVLGSLLESLPLSTDDGMLLRSNLLQTGTLRLLLLCLAVFTHQQPETPPSESNQGNGSLSKAKSEEKNKHYWAKGTGFGTGSTQQSWNVEESLLRQKTEEEHVTVLLQVISSYIYPGEVWNIPGNYSGSPMEEEGPSSVPDSIPVLPPEFYNIIHRSALLPAISSYLRNDSVLDMSRHIPLYLAVMKVVRAVMVCQASCVQSGNPSMSFPSSIALIPPLLHQMSCTVDTYAKKLKMNKKPTSSKVVAAAEGCEDDEGLARLIPDIQATSAMVQSKLGLNENMKSGNQNAILIRAPSTATREAKYLEVMKRLQFETFEMISECPDNGYKFNVSYHFESTVRAAGDHSHPARMKRLAQEAVTLSTSLPLSYSSSVFVRTDQDRLDIMKVLITGPSDTPYANGCFELDVYFPIEYPNAPMLINLETTGRHSVRFNPNLYLDGKVCLSVLNTWHGRPEEQWNAQTSSFLQVLVSIQSLILVPEPYFNEPGFERSRGTPGGTNHSLEYNSNIYQACVRWAMLEQLRNPTSCFQQVIRTHFWLKRDEICTVIEGWIEELETQGGDKRTQRNIKLNLIALKRHYKNLREELAKLTPPPGLEDLDTPFSGTSVSRESPRDSPTPALSPSAVGSTQQQIKDMEVAMDQLINEIVSQGVDEL